MAGQGKVGSKDEDSSMPCDICGGQGMVDFLLCDGGGHQHGCHMHCLVPTPKGSHARALRTGGESWLCLRHTPGGQQGKTKRADKTYKVSRADHRLPLTLLSP